MATLTVNDVLAANSLLMSLGAEDQIPGIAMKAIERSLELQSRVDRALTYAQHAPNSSTHARQMARILDGSITVDDELNEVPETGLPMARLAALPAAEPAAPQKAVKRSKGKLKPGNGLIGRSTKERLRIREWIAEQGFEIAPSGRIPQKYLDAYDEHMEILKNQRKSGHLPI